MIFMLILHSSVNPGMGIIVIVKTKALSDRVNLLLDENRNKEAFDLLKRSAIPESCIPDGHRFKHLIRTIDESSLN